MKNFLVITGGAGFVGSNLIELLIKKTNFKIVSIDNYSSGHRKNHIKNKRVKYLRGDTKYIDKLLKNKPKGYVDKVNKINDNQIILQKKSGFRRHELGEL